ncbi:MAG: alpha-amylase family glycosyl hydrolase [Clostridium tyrobutyricum]|jgi:glycosidase|uniref:alpha-amylase family glycosyl hydrolase n=1 Tax=Clostridium tyrobutyricum TaxID=1519 RepID=UPI00242A5B27|nr:alpha-amylase family glycosyl hydrolase [Clostridium tyrobutyricum]MCH4236698.1 alpha-amylase family glycosyl hydrolase [Clostridium tyrobutyricum]MCH4259770.1 alpha-amylase family glycosyl hydrolase [Clostridium tyrobutyricum]MCI1653626.1 alpha-amylase family glycosyl hydrolase [Clostridium tyrobutyricum]MCI1937893.1 alpha-amylase family glycosyl hydrolase [Clostridium tyrobutyricum]MCI1993855.1 alpha-amylase family glycosyl hydrolase [Clostridium tyrobutyricum]
MDFKLKHDSRESCYRKPFGAVPKGKKVYISITSNKLLEVYLHLQYFNYDEKYAKMNVETKENETYLYYYNIDLSQNYTGLINYFFRIKLNDDSYIYYGNNSDGLGGEGQVYYNNPVTYQITVYEPFKVPEWFKEGIVYQIFVDRFRNGNGKIINTKNNSFIYGSWQDEPMYVKDTNGKIARWDFFGGNLKGIIEKLDYIKSLGTTAIYLNPIFKSKSNHKYDTGDYKSIDEMYGNEEIFNELCKEANKLGIKIILDGVFNHTGDDSIYFNKYGNYNSTGAYQSKDSPYYKWYTFQEYPDKYDSWWGIDNMPSINEMESSYIDFIIEGKDSVLKKWMDLGVSGWRLDVADELPDDFIEKIKTKIKGIKEDSILIGEVWEDASNKISYSNRRKYVFGRELDSITNYPFRNAVIGFLNGNVDSKMFERMIISLYENYPKEIVYSNLNIIGTHDTERILTVLSNKQNDQIQFLKMAVTIQMTMPGVPLIYYGDEAGVSGGKDPLNRKTYPWGNENKIILKFYKYITGLRNKYDALKNGSIRFYDMGKDVLCYERTFKQERILIVINRNSSKSFDIKLDKISDTRILPLEIKILCR